MNIKLVASDLDGTIIDKNNNISINNFQAIDKLNSENIKFAICTGKSYSVSKNICDKFNASYGIFGNGTQIIDLKNGKELCRNILSKKDLLFVATLAKRFNLHLHLYSDIDVITEKLKFMDLRNYILQTENSSSNLNFKIVKDITKYIAQNDLSIFSAVVSSENSLKDFNTLLSVNKNINPTFIKKRGIYKDNIINKEYEYLNISPININKSEALNFLGNYLNIPKTNMMAIGDNLNDIEMVKNSGIGIAVGNSYDELKKVATYTTQKNVSEGGFAEAIYKFIK